VQFFFALVREGKHADVIYVQNAVAAGLPAVLAGVLLKKPVLLKFVGDEAWERATGAGKTNKNLDDFLAAPEGGLKTSLFIAIQKFVLAHVSAAVPPSVYLGEILKKFYSLPESRLTVNHNAFEAEVSAVSNPRVPRQILSVSRLVSWKRVDGIINAFKIVKNSYPDATLVVVGEGPEDAKLKKLAADAGVAAAVKFIGSVPRDEIQALERAAEIMVLNSTYEGLPHIVLESFATQTPLIATDIPGTNEVVIHEKNGLLVPKNDDATLAVAIERLFADPALRQSLVNGGSQTLKEKFSWDQHIQTLLAVMASVQDNKN
jgi:glycosyltransferase involved in cell wall biosynthesis